MVVIRQKNSALRQLLLRGGLFCRGLVSTGLVPAVNCWCPPDLVPLPGIRQTCIAIAESICSTSGGITLAIVAGLHGIRLRTRLNEGSFGARCMYVLYAYVRGQKAVYALLVFCDVMVKH